MKKIIPAARALLFTVALALYPLSSFGQSSSPPGGGVVPGYMSTIGCQSANLTPCFFSYTGSTPYHYLSLASTNSTNVKATAGQVFQVVGINTTAAIYYLKLYDKATAPTCGTDTVIQTYPVPASSTSTGGGFVISIPFGMNFANGIGFCLTGAVADNDATVAATGVVIDLLYK